MPAANPSAQLLQKLPKGFTLEYVENYLANKALFPKTIPVSKKTTLLESVILKNR